MAKVEDIDRGYKAILKQLKLMEKDPYVKIGYTKDEKRDGGTSLITIASVHEFGSPINNIPERSFLRSAVSKHGSRIGKIIGRGYDDIIKGKSTVLKILTRVGVLVEGLTKTQITNVQKPPLKVSPREPDGGSNPLINTGHLRNSIKYEVKMNGEQK